MPWTSPDENVIDLPAKVQDEEAVKSISASSATGEPSGTLSVLSLNIEHSRSDSVALTTAASKLDFKNGADCENVSVMID